MMMKKLLAVLLAAMFLAACGNDKPAESKAEAEPKTEPEVVTEMGSGNFYLVNESGSTKDKESIEVMVEKDTSLLQIGIETEGIDGSLVSYIYIDGKLATKEQLSDSQASLDLSEDFLKPGDHQVVLKQYPDNDEKADPVTVKVANYKVSEL